MNNSNEKLENLRKELREHRGSIKEIAHRRGFNRESVRQVLAGKWMDEQVLTIAAEVLIERKAQRQPVFELIAKAIEA